MSSMLSRIGLVSALTLLSRVLGLARDIATSAVFGATVWNSAFVTAFTLPNLFRRLLGEGALTAALMPNLGEELERGGKEAVHLLVNKTLSWLLTICVGLTLLATVAFVAIESAAVAEKWVIGARVGKLVFPYIILICLAAIVSAALNLFGKFGLPALTAVWLNLSILLSLGLGGWYLGGNLPQKMLYLCVGVLVGGLFQLLVPMLALMREGWRPAFDFRVSPALKSVAWLTMPGIFGAAVHQINVMVSRGLAFYFNESGATLLYLANRLVELPVGVFAIAVSTVVFPSLSRFAASANHHEFRATYLDGMVIASMMSIPAAVGLALLSEEAARTLFEHGLFRRSDTETLAPIVVAYAVGIPALSFVSIETRAFFALKNTKTPVRVAAVAMAINLVLSVALLPLLGIIGLAIASNVAIYGQAVLLHLVLRREFYAGSLRSIGSPLGKIALGSLLMAALVLAGQWLLEGALEEGHRRAAWSLAILIPLGAGAYFVALKKLGVDQVEEFTRLLGRRKRRESYEA